MYRERIYQEICIEDLEALYEIANKIFTDYFKEKNKKYTFSYDFDKPYCIALCQGAALHFVDGKHGVKDFDVWYFFENTIPALPYRLRLKGTFSNTKFPDRNIDVLFRNIRIDRSKSIHENMKAYLRTKNRSPQKLSQKPFVFLMPGDYFGQVL